MIKEYYPTKESQNNFFALLLNCAHRSKDDSDLPRTTPLTLRGSDPLTSRLSVQKTEKQAAVVMGLQFHAESWRLLLIKRSRHLVEHRGEIAFPGGVADAGETPVTTALRELDEELNIPPELVNVIGAFPARSSSTGYLITPILAILPQNVSWRCQPAEVETAFWVSIAFFMDKDNARVDTLRQAYHRHKVHNIVRWTVPGLDIDIWGVTADMIATLIHAWRATIKDN